MSGASAGAAGRPSPFVLAWLDAALDAAALGPALDLAGGEPSELVRAGAFRVYRDPRELDESLDELGVLP